MDPIILQKQLRDNNSDLMSFCADLKQWGQEMKQKDSELKGDVTSEVPLVKKKKKTDSPKPKAKQIKGFDYSSWDNYDVEAECAKIDKEDESGSSGELTDELETKMEEALYHKEKGNKFVKKQNWNQAIDCYTKALNCYGYDPVFYANRALCHLKNSDYRLAESDCTAAIQLDNTYVKAYHRRAQAREALNQLNEAHDDLLKVFDYEPDNKESKNSLAKLEKKLESVAKQTCTRNNHLEHRPKSKFTLSRQQLSGPPPKPKTVVKQTKIACESTSSYWPSGNNVQLVTAIDKAPHLRSKMPLRRINITDTDCLPQREQVFARPLPSAASVNKVINCEDLRVVERKVQDAKIISQENRSDTKVEDTKLVKNEKISLDNQQDDTKIIKASSKDEFRFNIPETSVQFNYDWKLLRHKLDWQHLYLKQIQPRRFKKIFNESLECDVFSGIINILATTFIDKNIPVYEYLVGLTEVKRFSMLSMFLNENDKESLWKLIDYTKSDRNVFQTDVDNLINKYNL